MFSLAAALVGYVTTRNRISPNRFHKPQLKP
jgi:hypothetical protein